MHYDNEIQSSNTLQRASNGFVDDEGEGFSTNRILPRLVYCV